MGKISRGGGASHAVPAGVVARIRRLHGEGSSLSDLRTLLNREAVPYPDVDGTPRTGLWTNTAVQQLIDGGHVA